MRLKAILVSVVRPDINVSVRRREQESILGATNEGALGTLGFEYEEMTKALDGPALFVTHHHSIFSFTAAGTGRCHVCIYQRPALF